MQEGLWYGLFQFSNLWMSSLVTEQCVILVKVQDCWFKAGNSPPLHQKLYFMLAWVTFCNICSYWPIDPDHMVESSWSQFDIECICIHWEIWKAPSDPLCGNPLYFKCVLQNWLRLSFGLNITCNNTQFVMVRHTWCDLMSIYLWPQSCFSVSQNSKNQSIVALMKTRNQQLVASSWWQDACVWLIIERTVKKQQHWYKQNKGNRECLIHIQFVAKPVRHILITRRN